MADPLVAAGYAVATLLSVAVLRRSLRARHRPGAAWLAFVMTGVTWWAALSVGLALNGDPYGPVGTLLGRLEWFGIAVVAVGVVRLGLAMSGRDDRLSNRAVGALLSVPFAWSVVGLAHADVVGLARDVSPALGTALSALVPLVSLYVWLNPVIVGGVYVALAVGTVLVLETAFERPGARLRQVLVLLMVLPPWTLNVLYLAGLTPNAGYDPTVLGFVVTGVAGIAAIDRVRLFETPFARSEVVEHLDTPIMAFGADGHLYDYNERAVTVLGLDEESLDEPIGQVLDRTPLRVEVPVPPTDGGGVPRLDGVEATLDRSVGRGADAADRTGVESGAGPTPDHYLLTTTELGRRGGQSLGYAVQLSDITRQRRQRERLREKSRRLERKNEQLERLAGIVAHDMQTPVSTGRRLLDLLEMDLGSADDEELARTLADLDEVFDRLDGFVEHLPRLARESVDVERPVECDLEALARDAWGVVDTDGLGLRVRDTATLQGDPRRLQQVLENLFRNAVEHGAGTGVAADGEGATVVRVGTLSAPDDDGGSRGFYVEDDGVGIPADRRDDAFEFGDGDGTGYGLAIVRTVARAHGWSVALTESPEGGARFEFDCSNG